MQIIWLLIKASWISATLAILTGITSGVCSARLIALVNSAISQNATQSLLISFAGLSVLAFVTGSLSQFLLVDLAQNSVYQLRLRLSQRILASSLRQLEQLGPSRLFAVLTQDVQAISNTVFVIPFLCIDLAVVGGCLIYLGWLSIWVFLIVAAFMVVAIPLVQLLLNFAYRYLNLARQEDDQLFTHFRSITDGLKELKLHSVRRQTFFTEDLSVSAGKSRQFQKNAFKFAALSSGGGQFLFFLLLGVLLFGVPEILPSTQAVLPAYILTLSYLMGPLGNIIQRLPNLASANVSIQKVNQMGLKLAEHAEVETVVTKPTPKDWNQLKLAGVVHTYQDPGADHQFRVGPIDLTINSGELVFIVGGNGSGKSTLAKLITGLYTPESGEIHLDAEPIVDTNREWYRQLFSTVFADYYLFERLISEEFSTLDAQARAYLRKLELEQKVSVQDGQLSTTGLSQGQRKRLALLSAYLENRSIYLFDEWAADQDPIFREIFYTQLLAELKQRGKTVLVISHDDHFFHLADRIIKLDYGRIESDQD
ncbi:cyclic peptide export ABC transporter [Acaryochloris sp. CCMEE 5410]|uniref:cyclic peptide export ABC transporter n=1 Tax=Acaryochloris sp. CCMEE 5410 TaxID=310037 RepID=UPI0002484283|nr:cyclic peptide export ABC transporter [Acaryochloris sp. CCMEE 5410]KAI9133078.1 cyclic peptide export ABC transporter [Acaryochloris sp. CCMEE 5410]